MSDLISRSALIKNIKGIYIRVAGIRSGKGILSTWMNAYREKILSVIREQPTIEVAPVVHGEWERTNITCEDGWALYRCTNCDWHTTYYYSFSASPTYNFCPNCGADMRGKEQV